jgi:hypothetical protein
MRRILINNDFGGFGISYKAFLRLRELGSKEALEKDPDNEHIRKGIFHDIPRDDKLLLQVFDEMGQEAAGFCSHLKAVEIPLEVEWEIEEYDGSEWVSEKHRTWA